MTTQYELVAEMLDHLVRHQAEPPSLADLARQFGRSEAHIQRTFQAYAGVSPKQFVRMLTREKAIERLKQGASVLDAALQSGLSGPGRLHDLLISTDALTPGEARRNGAGVTLGYGFGSTPFGAALLAWSNRGIVFLGFTQSTGGRDALEQLQRQWPDAQLVTDTEKAKARLDQIFDPVHTQPLKLWLRGSPFQLKVWEALLEIPPGQHASYQALAKRIGKEKASRAVGAAIGRNPVSWLIPCHRVITGTGALGGYRWGLNTKQAMIGIEAAGVTGA